MLLQTLICTRTAINGQVDTRKAIGKTAQSGIYGSPPQAGARERRRPAGLVPPPLHSAFPFWAGVVSVLDHTSFRRPRALGPPETNPTAHCGSAVAGDYLVAGNSARCISLIYSIMGACADAQPPRVCT